MLETREAHFNDALQFQHEMESIHHHHYHIIYTYTRITKLWNELLIQICYGLFFFLSWRLATQTFTYENNDTINLYNGFRVYYIFLIMPTFCLLLLFIGVYSKYYYSMLDLHLKPRQMYGMYGMCIWFLAAATSLYYILLEQRKHGC